MNYTLFLLITFILFSKSSVEAAGLSGRRFKKMTPVQKKQAFSSYLGEKNLGREPHRKLFYIPLEAYFDTAKRRNIISHRGLIFKGWDLSKLADGDLVTVYYNPLISPLPAEKLTIREVYENEGNVSAWLYDDKGEPLFLLNLSKPDAFAMRRLELIHQNDVTWIYTATFKF